MKKFGLISCIVSSILSCSFVLGACGGAGDENSTGPYTIQYADEKGVHTLTVEEGSLYSIESLPTRYGYDFLGLYSLKEGGVQYVDKNGTSIMPFYDGVDLVLFPQFQAKEYTLIFDFQGAPVIGNRSQQVSYDSTLSGVPVNVNLEAKEFTGWYTEPEGKGLQVADRYGALSSIKINENNFDLESNNGNIYLYAAFKDKEYDLTLDFGNGETETLKVAHGTKLSDIVYETRLEGYGVAVWSTEENDTDQSNAFWGKITSDLTLYAAEYAPILDFQENGGEEISPIVARTGTTISLPVPVRENYQFVEWQDENGDKYNSTVMPSESMILNAVWQAKIIFDENGGKEVADISTVVGEMIELPVATREGYIFAGWYLGEKKYENNIMPSVSVQLTAKYYKHGNKKIVILNASSDSGASATSGEWYSARRKPNMEFLCNTLDLTEIYELGVKNIEITVHYQSRVQHANYIYTHMSWYSEQEASEAYKLWEYEEHNATSNYQSYTRTATLKLDSPKMYISRWATRPDGGGIGAWWKDFWVEIEYPDFITLY